MRHRVRCVPLSSCADEVGGKGRALAAALAAGSNVLPTLVIPASELDRVLSSIVGAPELKNLMDAPTYSPIVYRRLASALSCEAGMIELRDGADRLPAPAIARSSSVVGSQDAAAISGAYVSVRVNNRRDLFQAVRRVWLSAFTEAAYSQNRLLPRGRRVKGMAVLIQHFVVPVVSGLLHRRESIYPREDTIEVSWIKGHLRKIVSGRETGSYLRICPGMEPTGPALVAQEEVIVASQKLGLFRVFETLVSEVRLIEAVARNGFEAEWLFDGTNVWIVQVQDLVGERIAG
jgi:Pyruvate phosphate dikinase, AMP/ATP-binding domain